MRYKDCIPLQSNVNLSVAAAMHDISGNLWQSKKA